MLLDRSYNKTLNTTKMPNNKSYRLMPNNKSYKLMPNGKRDYKKREKEKKKRKGKRHYSDGIKS